MRQPLRVGVDQLDEIAAKQKKPRMSRRDQVQCITHRRLQVKNGKSL